MLAFDTPHYLPRRPPLQDYLASFTSTFGGVPLQPHSFNWLRRWGGGTLNQLMNVWLSGR
jgi:hypothetical protein